MEGCNTIGDDPALYTNPHITQLGYNSVYSEAEDPLDFYPACSPGAGPGMTLADGYYTATGRNLTLVTCAVGGTGFGPPGCYHTDNMAWNEWNWVDVTNASNVYYLYYQCWKLTHSLLQQGNYTLKGIFWVQGESNIGTQNEANCQISQSGPDHANNVTQIVNGWRQDLNSPNATFIVGTMVPGYIASISGSTPNAIPVQLTILQTPWVLNLSSVSYGFDTNGQGLDNSGSGGTVHYNWNAQRTIGTTMARAYFASLFNYAGSVTPGSIVQTFIDQTTLNSTSVSLQREHGLSLHDTLQSKNIPRCPFLIPRHSPNNYVFPSIVLRYFPAEDM